MIEVRSFQTANEALASQSNTSAFFGGGTLLMRALNYGQQDFDTLLRVLDPAMKQITTSGDRITIGAGVTMSAVMAAPELDFLAPVARSVGGPAVRNMATVGGNLFAPHPYGDFTAACLALDAKVKMADGNEQDMETFLAGRKTQRGLVVSVNIARPNQREFRYKKVSRVKPKGISVMSIAAWLPGGGQLSNPRIAFGAMGPTPLRAKQAEAALSGKPLDGTSIDAACAALERDLQPSDDAIASAWYRREVAPVHLKRLLTNGELR